MLIHFSKMRRFFIDWFPYAVILLLPAAVFYWLVPLWSNLSIGNDYQLFPLQHQLELQYSLSKGTFPIYVPGFGGGQSSAALTLGQLHHPISHIAAVLPGYWNGKATVWLTSLRLISLGICQAAVFALLVLLRMRKDLSFVVSFIAVYNLRMLDMMRYGASMENYTGYILLCVALCCMYLKRTRALGPMAIVLSTYLLVTGGHPQFMYIGLLGAGAVMFLAPCAMAAIDPSISITHGTIFRYYLKASIWIAAGILLASIYTLPFYFDFLKETSQRVSNDYSWSLAYSDSVGGVLRNLYRPLSSAVSGAFGGSALILLGAVAPILAVVRKRVPASIAATVFFLILIVIISMGRATILHRWFWEYFPFAHSFRVPGRITAVISFPLALLTAWILHQPDDEPMRLRLPAITWASIAAISILLIFYYFVDRFLPNSTRYVPSYVNHMAAWVEKTVNYLGITTLVLVGTFGLLKNKSKTVAGIALCILVVGQVSLCLRYGTWVANRRTTWTMKYMDARHKDKPGFHGLTGYGMEPASVIKQMSRSMLDPNLASFYRCSICVDSEQAAEQMLSEERRGDEVVAEGCSATIRCPIPIEQGSMDRVKLLSNTTNRFVFQVEAGTKGFLTVSFPFTGNWLATVDGVRADVLRANGYELGLALDKGRHSVVIQASSRAFDIGLGVSATMFAILSIYFCFVLVQKKMWRVLLAIVCITAPAAICTLINKSVHAGENIKSEYQWSSKQLPDRNNLAFGRRTQMSSSNMGQEPIKYNSGRGVDGEKKTGVFSTDSKKISHWWEVDLGRPYHLSHIFIYGLSNSIGKPKRPLEIFAYTDYKSGLKPFATLAEEKRKSPLRIEMKGQQAKYIRLKTEGRGPLSAIEIEVFGAEDNPEIAEPKNP